MDFILVTIHDYLGLIQPKWSYKFKWKYIPFAISWDRSSYSLNRKSAAWKQALHLWESREVTREREAVWLTRSPDRFARQE